MSGKPTREEAKAVLLDVLGMRPEDNVTDDDDFYLLGGDSILAVEAIEKLEELGFCVDLSVFYQTGHIGELLDSIVQSRQDKDEIVKVSTTMKSLSVREPSKDEPLDSLFDVVEWKGRESGATSEEILKIMSDIFMEKDALYHALHLIPSDMKSIIGNFFLPDHRNFVLLAFLHNDKTEDNSITAKRTLVGAVLSSSLDDFESCSITSPTLQLLQKYLDSSHPLHTDETDQVPKNKTFYVGMIGVVPPYSKELKEFPQYDESKWKRMILTILSQFEKKLMEQAREAGFTRMERVNTTEITMKFSLEMGYRIVGTSCLKDFAKAEQITVNPKYENHQCYYMVKDLDE